MQLTLITASAQVRPNWPMLIVQHPSKQSAVKLVLHAISATIQRVERLPLSTRATVGMVLLDNGLQSATPAKVIIFS